MLGRLAVKFYFRHAKRSFRGSKIVAISLLAVFISQILILAFSTQLSGLTQLVKNSEDYMIITPEHAEIYDQHVYDQIIDFGTTNQAVIDIFTEFRQEGVLELSNARLEGIQLHFVDLSKINRDIDNIRSVLYYTKDLKSLFAGEDVVNVTYGTEASQEFLPATSLDNAEASIDSGLYIDYTAFNVTERSHIYFQVANSRYRGEIQDILEENYPVSIQTASEEAQFIRDSKDNIERVLVVLTIMISVLIVLGISNLISTILFESRYDIRTLKAIGYSIIRIRTLFLILTGILGFVGSLIAIIIGVTLPNIVFSSLAIVSQNIYIPTQVTLRIIIQTIVVGIFVPVISALRPTWRHIS